MRFRAPSRIRGPIDARVHIPYEVVGAGEIRIDPLDPDLAAWTAAPLGVIRAVISTEPAMFRLEASSGGIWARHSIVVEPWDNPWLGVEGAHFPAFSRGIPEVPRLLRAQGRVRYPETGSDTALAALDEQHVPQPVSLVLVVGAM